MPRRAFVPLASALAALVALAGSGQAQAPSIGDIASCNQEAAAKTGDPSALPRPGPHTPDPSRGMPDAREGVPTARDPGPASPSAPVGPALDPPAGGSVGQKTDPSGSIITQSPDPLLKGMDAERAGDPAYRAAYRQCMVQRRSR
jgi:hypothetical protein